MKHLKLLFLVLFLCCFASACTSKEETPASEEVEPTQERIAVQDDGATDIIFLHHSTGQAIWDGGVPEWFEDYNSQNNKNYQINAQEFPKDQPYGWENYPYDYWNIWVNHAGQSAYQTEPTLEMLSQDYEVVVFKHCFPVSQIEADYEAPVIDSPDKTLGNYRLQYDDLKNKMHQFPDTRFIVWTGAVETDTNLSNSSSTRMREFVEWIKGVWDEKDDNIYVWDFYQLETEGGYSMANNNAAGADDAHPNESFSKKVAPLFSQRVVDVIEGRGDNGSLTGE